MGRIVRREFIRLQTFKKWLVWPLLCALALRALLPAGFMPDFSGLSDSYIVICSGSGAVEIALGSDGEPVPRGAPETHEQPCAFATVAVLELPVFDASTLPNPNPEQTIFSSAKAFTLHLIRAGPHLGSRGPPSIS